MSLVRCHTCNGSKNVLGLGGMLNPCGVCDAIGYCEVNRDDKVNEPKARRSDNGRSRARKQPEVILDNMSGL